MGMLGRGKEKEMRNDECAGEFYCFEGELEDLLAVNCKITEFWQERQKTLSSKSNHYFHLKETCLRIHKTQQRLMIEVSILHLSCFKALSCFNTNTQKCIFQHRNNQYIQSLAPISSALRIIIDLIQKMKAILVVLLVMSVLSFEVQQSLGLSDLLERKKTAVKTDIFGREVKVVLKQKGSGISDAQQTYALKLMEQGASVYGQDLVGNAKFIAQKIQDSWSGRWNVEIFGGDPSWGRSTHISQDKWLLFFAWGDYELDYIIWAPDC